MKKLVSSLIYILSLILILSFLVVFTTENTSIVSKLYKKDIIKSIQKSPSINYSFDNLSIKWNGLDPSLIFKNISLYDKDNNKKYLNSEKLILKVDFISSISEMSFIPEEINLVNSNVDLIYDKTGIFIKDYNILDRNNTKDSLFDNIKFRITDSNITIYDKTNSTGHELININMVIFNQNNQFRLFTTFNHQSSKEVIHLASNFSLNNNMVSGRIYSQGINVNLDSPANFYQKFNINANQLNYIFWADIANNEIVDLDGYFEVSSSKISNYLTKGQIILNDFSSNIFYKSKNGISNLSFTNLNFQTNNNKYKNNNLMLTKTDDILTNFSIDKLYVNDFKKTLRLLTIPSFKVIQNSTSLFENGILNNMLALNINDKKNFKYQLFFDQVGLQGKGIIASNLSGNIKGNSQIGYLKLDSKDVGFSYNTDRYPFSKINGDIYLKYINNKVSLSSNNIKLDNLHTAKISGSFSSKVISYQIDLQGQIDNIQSKIPSNLNLGHIFKETQVDTKYHIDFRSYNVDNKNYNYGAVSLTDLVIKNNRSSAIINTKKIVINFFDKYFQSHPSHISVNNSKFVLSIDTDISDGVIKYIANSKGSISDSFVKTFIDHKLMESFQGKTVANIQLIYEAKNKKLYTRLKSNLEGMSLNIISPFKKDLKSSKDFELSYIMQENRRNNIDIKYDIYKMQLSKSNDSLYAVIDSPTVSGTLVLPEDINIDNRFIARLKYLDFNKFEGIANPENYPYLDMDIKTVRINKHYFEDFKIKTSPIKNGMLIDQLDFSNVNLVMTGNGKWLNTNDGQITLFDARFVSDNFGKSLDKLGYKDLIKDGSLSSQLIGQWNGSPDYFSLNDFDGKITIELNSGEILQVSKQSRAIGQLLGLFSISSLQKRLSLDFSDFFSSGLSFDDMSGEFVFVNSRAKTNDLILKGSFGEMRINGTSDLKNKLHDQKLVYIPDLSSMSLISGTLLGGPVGALASIFYDKFLEEIGIDTNQLAAVEYSIKGSWDNPEIKVIESFKPITN